MAQSPIEGVSFKHTFDDADVPGLHTTQYFEMFGQRAIDHDGWRAVCGWPGSSYADGATKGRKLGDDISPEMLDELDATGWELFHIAEDPSEARDVAAEQPEKLREMIARWCVGGGQVPRAAARRQPVPAPVGRAPAAHRGPDELRVLPRAVGRPVRVARRRCSTARTASPPRSRSRRAGRRACCSRRAASPAATPLRQGRQAALRPQLPQPRGARASPRPSTCPRGRSRCATSSSRRRRRTCHEGHAAPAGAASSTSTATLVGDAEIPVTVPIIFGIEGLSCGYDFGEAVTEAYRAPFRSRGTIKKVTVDLSGELIQDDEAQVALMMAQQ